MSFRSGRATGVVDLAVEPAARVGVTIKATDVALECGESIEGFVDDRDYLILVEVEDVGLGLLGLVLLSGDDSLDREEDDRLISEELLQDLELFWGCGIRYEVILHAWARQHDFEELVGSDDGKCLGGV